MYDISKCLGLEPSPICKVQLQQKDLERVGRQIIKPLNIISIFEKQQGRKEKGYEDKNQEDEGIMYSSGAFDVPDLQVGPSKRQKND